MRAQERASLDAELHEAQEHHCDHVHELVRRPVVGLVYLVSFIRATDLLRGGGWRVDAESSRCALRRRLAPDRSVGPPTTHQPPIRVSTARPP